MAFDKDIGKLKEDVKKLVQPQTNLESAISAIYAETIFKVAQKVQAESPDEPVPRYDLLETNKTLSDAVRTVISDTYSLKNPLHPLHRVVTEDARAGTGNYFIDEDIRNLYTPGSTLTEMLGLAKSPAIGMTLGTIQTREQKKLQERNQTSTQEFIQRGIDALDLPNRKDDAVKFFITEYGLNVSMFSKDVLASKLPQMSGIYITGTPTSKEQIYQLLK